MALKSPRFAADPRLQAAASNSPPMRYGETGDAVLRVQDALIELGYPMPISTQRLGFPDGVFKDEMLAKVREFQAREKLSVDGVVGRQTLERLDIRFIDFFPAPEPEPDYHYTVPGQKPLIAQTTSMTCWAYSYTMMLSWKLGSLQVARTAIKAVGPKWLNYFDHNQGLAPGEAENFFRDARMKFSPLVCYAPRGWVAQLRQHGLLWVGSANQQGGAGGLHARVIEGFKGDGSAYGSAMKIMDPDGGRRYDQVLGVFNAKFEETFGPLNRSYQIAHF